MAKRFTVVAPDMRGYNLTDKPEGVDKYRMSNLVEDVKEIISSLGRKKAYLVGHDWGGAVAWAFAARYPQHLHKLVIMNAPHPILFSKQVATNPRQMLKSWYMILFQLHIAPELLIRAFDYKALEVILRSTAVRKEAFTDTDIMAYKDALSKPGALNSSINYYRAAFRGLRGGKKAPGFPSIKVPTLVIWGEQDPFLGCELTYDLREQVDDAFTIKYIPRCGHWVQQEYPALVNKYLDEFL